MGFILQWYKPPPIPPVYSVSPTRISSPFAAVPLLFILLLFPPLLLLLFLLLHKITIKAILLPYVFIHIFYFFMFYVIIFFLYSKTHHIKENWINERKLKQNTISESSTSRQTHIDGFQRLPLTRRAEEILSIGSLEWLRCSGSRCIGRQPTICCNTRNTLPIVTGPSESLERTASSLSSLWGRGGLGEGRGKRGDV